MDDLDSYISPIQRIAKDIQARIEEHEGEIMLKAVHNVGFDVDKHELMKALSYDREQYKKGYADAMKNAVPLDKLCEWLANSFSDPPCCMLENLRCEMECGFTKISECWMYVLTGWMEGLDGNE